MSNRKQRGSEFVYFVLAEESGLIKIGRGSNMAQRLAALRTGNHDTLRLLGIVRDDDPAHLERMLHHEYRGLHRRGEWYRAAPELLDFIGQYAKSLEQDHRDRMRAIGERLGVGWTPPANSPASIKGNSRKAVLARYKLARGIPL